jgi:hypothetical protein
VDNENIYDIQVDLSHLFLTPEHMADTSYLKKLSSVTESPAMSENTDHKTQKECQISSDQNSCTDNLTKHKKVSRVTCSSFL